MTRSEHFEELRAELAMSGTTGRGSRATLLSETAAVKQLCRQLAAKLKEAKRSSNIQVNASDGLEWSMISSSGHCIGVTSEKKLRLFGSMVITETSIGVLTPRMKLLRLPRAAELRFRLRLEINQWVVWNPSGLTGGVKLEYWDRLPDELPLESQLYLGDKRKKIRDLYQKHTGWLGDLGDYLTRSPALCNNPNAPVAERVMSSEVKEAVDYLIEVRTELDFERGPSS